MAKEASDGLPDGTLSGLDKVRISVKSVGMVITTVAYSICHEVISWLPVMKTHATPITCILVGGVAGAVVLLYEKQFLGKVVSPEQQSAQQFPPAPAPVFPPPTFPPANNSNPNP